MRIECEAIIVAVRAHGEHGAIVRALTPADGLQAGYVRGGRSRRLRPVLSPGNVVQADFRARTDTQLPQLTVGAQPQPRPALRRAARRRRHRMGLRPSPPRLCLKPSLIPRSMPGWTACSVRSRRRRARAVGSAALVRYELLLLDQLGYGLDEERLLSLPPGLRAGGVTDDAAVREGLRISGAALARDILVDRRAEVLAARERLVARLGRMAG